MTVKETVIDTSGSSDGEESIISKHGWYWLSVDRAVRTFDGALDSEEYLGHFVCLLYIFGSTPVRMHPFTRFTGPTDGNLLARHI